MGLAPYGDPTKCINQITKMHDLDNTNSLVFKNRLGGIHLFEQNKRIESSLQYQRFDNIASAIQERYETLTITWIKNAIKKTGIHKLAFAGGNFQNVKANQKILALEEVDDAFFCPAASDEGLAVGAALQGYFTLAFNDGILPNKVPLKKAVDPNEIAVAILFILNSNSLTGQLINIDSGQHLGWAHANNKKIIDE